MIGESSGLGHLLLDFMYVCERRKPGWLARQVSLRVDHARHLGTMRLLVRPPLRGGFFGIVIVGIRALG